MKKLLLSVCTAAIAGALALAPSAHAVPVTDDEGITTIRLYSENRGLARIDNNEPGPDNSDLVHRELALSWTRSGPVIGVSYSQAEIVAFNEEAKVDIRLTNIQESIPGGIIFMTGLSELAIGSYPGPGWTETFAVIGGTGKYAGARGTAKKTLLEDGKTFEVDITLLP